jgi:hypothetical protein
MNFVVNLREASSSKHVQQAVLNDCLDSHRVCWRKAEHIPVFPFLAASMHHAVDCVRVVVFLRNVNCTRAINTTSLSAHGVCLHLPGHKMSRSKCLLGVAGDLVCPSDLTLWATKAGGWPCISRMVPSECVRDAAKCSFCGSVLTLVFQVRLLILCADFLARLAAIFTPVLMLQACNTTSSHMGFLLKYHPQHQDQRHDF